jgi:nucleoside-diphosphate-sugar epimerase
MGPLHCVLGAAGAVGQELVPALLRRGVPVRAVHRRDLPERDGVQNVVADVATPEGAAHALEGVRTAYVCAQPPYTRWAQEFPALLATVADAATRAGARLVLLDNLYGYGPVDGPMTEQTPQAATSRKGRVRAAMAQDLLRRHAAGNLQVAIGRASDYVGPRGKSLPNVLTLEPVARGKRGRWVGRLDRPHSVNVTGDIARGLAVLGTREEALGRAWHLPVSGSPTGGSFVELAHRVGGVSAGPGLVTPLLNRLAGLFVPDVREGNELMYEFTEPFVVDDSAFRAAFPDEPAATPTPLEAAVADAVEARRRSLSR